MWSGIRFTVNVQTERQRDRGTERQKDRETETERQKDLRITTQNDPCVRVYCHAHGYGLRFTLYGTRTHVYMGLGGCTLGLNVYRDTFCA